MPSPAESIIDRVRKRILLAMLVALAATVSVAESNLPNPLPWMRFGLANAVTLLVLIHWGLREALGVTVARVVLASLISGGFLGPAFMLSFGGALASVSVMGLLALPGRFSAVGLSAAGSFTHTLTQFALLPILMGGDGSLMRAAPPFLLLSLPAGALTGWLVQVSGRILTGESPHE